MKGKISMKKLLMKSLFVGSIMFFTFACGGGGGGGNSNVVDETTTQAELEADSAAAFADSDWSDKTPATVDDTNSVTLSTNVQNAVSTVAAQATAGVNVSKSNKIETINETIEGPLGGTAVVTGSYTYNTTGAAGYPMTFSYDFKIVFNNYKDSTIAINGEVSYSGDTTASSATSSETNIEVNGGYSVLYQEQAYNIVTKIEAQIDVVNQSSISVTYTYTVNGEEFTGSYDLGL